MSLISNHALVGAQMFIGVVEDRDDPEHLGRVRVRVFGLHTEDKEKIPTDQLPWATPTMPYTSASISGIGMSPTGPVEGTWVVGFFIDGREMQQPVVIGTLIGNPTERIPKDEGFSDPEGLYPIIETPGESDVNRLARGKSIEESTINSKRPGEKVLAVKDKARIKNVAVAKAPKIDTVLDGEPPGKGKRKTPFGFRNSTGVTAGTFGYHDRLNWNEPTARYGGQEDGGAAPLNITEVKKNNADPKAPSKSKYPFNHVHVTERGHIHEIDDSPNAERIHQYHSSGTFTEIQPNGTRVTKVVGDDYEMVMNGKNMLVSGNVNITVDGADLRLFVKRDDKDSSKGGDMYIETDGDLSFNVKGDMNTKIGGTEHKEVISDSATNINGKKHLRVGKDYDTIVDGDVDIKTQNSYLLRAEDMIDLNAGGFMNLTATLEAGLTASNGAARMSGTSAVLNGDATVDLTGLVVNVGDVTDTTHTNIAASAEVDITAATNVDINATRIDLN